MPFASIHVWKQAHDKAPAQHAAEKLLDPFMADLGGQNGEKTGSPAWNYGP